MAVLGLVLFGLNVWDLIIILAFLIALLTIGVVVSHTIKKESDFYLGGRKLGRWLQFFLNFGNSTDTTGAVAAASAVFKQGAGGVWNAGFQTLFITPFFWFTQPWWRRARLTTMGDLFVDRYNSRSLASAYACFNIFMALFTMGMGNYFAYTVAHAMIVKPESAYTDQDRTKVKEYQEYQSLVSQIKAGHPEIRETERYQELDSKNKRGAIESFVSYVTPTTFYLIYSTIVGIYIVLGGLKAAAITDAIQGLLILAMSVLLIPLGLHRLGGFAGLHRVVPAFRFVTTSDQTWYSILAVTFASFIQIIGILHNMSTGGSAKDEDTARFGMITGGFTKRLVIICWVLCGLIGLAFLTGKISDPGNTWGALSLTLLPAGLMGLMLSGMLLGHMPTVGVSAVAVSGLAVRNIYEPLVKGKSDEHYLKVGQWSIAVVLLVAIAFALESSSVQSAYTQLVTFNTFFGAAIVLMIFWKRLTASSIMISFVIWVVLIGLIPFFLPQVPWLRQQPGLVVSTDKVSIIATPKDVAAGKAQNVGQIIDSDPQAIYFDSVARANPDDPNSKLEGIGRFNVENFILHLFGVPVQRFSSSDNTASRWGFDGVFPFICLFFFSFVTKPTELERADRFYAKLRTPVAPTPEEDRHEVALSLTHPHRFDHKRLFPGTNWQFNKWARKDYIGFFGCWAIAGVILLLMWWVVGLGAAH
jgi:SSS family solute:Na+ symporter